jgi:ketosteroid isomerase-like protein
MLYTRILWCCVAVTAASIAWMVWAPNTSKADDRRAIKAAVSSYVHAFATGDGRAACDHLTDGARKAVIDAAGRVGASSCPAAFERTLKLGGKKVKATARKIRVRKIDLDGGGARVTLRAAGQDAVADLQKVDGKWKIASLPKA